MSVTSTAPSGSPGNPRWDRAFFGHPVGLSTLFFTEMWERFSYYGMRALLILFMTATAAKGGLGFPASKAGAVYGLYTSLVYLLGLPGGWVADRITGQRKAVLYGGIIIAAGHLLMAFPSLETFYAGLVLIVLGTGLLKPNISTMVGELYSATDKRRDSGFSIFYMGINLGAFVSPLVCGYLGENINWHYGFGAAGIGMTLGLIQYVAGAKYLGTAGTKSNGTPRDVALFQRTAAGLAAIVAIVAALMFSGILDANRLSDLFGIFLVATVAIFFGWLLTNKHFTSEERGRLGAIFVFFFAAALFWSVFEQAGSTLNLFAERNTNLHAWDFPLWGLFRASYFQSFNSVFLIIFAPVFALVWMKLGKREPTSTSKFSIGLIFVGLGFAILIPVSSGVLVSPWWLTLTYLLHTIGELCLSPVGLSAMTKLAPVRVAGLMMGVWFMATSVGNFIGGRIASVYESFPLPTLFAVVAGFAMLIGMLMFFLSGRMKRMMGGVN